MVLAHNRTMSRCSRGRSRIGFLLVALGTLVLTSCSQPARISTISRSPSTSDTSSDCVQTEGLGSAHSGRLSAGPFLETTGHFKGAHGAKFWVASTVAEPPGATASIQAHQMGTDRSVRVERNASRRAQVPDVPTFFPGVLRLPAHGDWRIHVTIGKQTGCFDVRA
jgi:hypothetical protein